MKREERISRDEYFMGIAMAVRARANCLGSRVGAVIVLEGRIISTGYNGTPSGMTNCLEGGCLRCSRREDYPPGAAYDLCICVHAEQNALLAAARFGISVQSAVLFTTMRPCFGCTKEMLQAKIHSVVYLHEWHPSENTRAEYERLQAALPGGMRRLEIEDPRAEWAISKRRVSLQESVDETGHGAG